MRTAISAAVLGIGLLLGMQPILAHHSFAAEFDGNKPIVLKGTVKEMVWSNPHGWLYIEVKAPDGKMVTWALELGTPNAMYRRGWRKTDLPIGTAVTVEGFLAKDGSPTANATSILMPDGRKLGVGSSGTGSLR
jgi:hypothetical protein